VAHVNVKDVKQFKIPLPSFDAQKQFSSFVHQVDKSKSVIQKSLDETQLLFDSLMQEYFG
jgi:type I restriction enzyme S subunit